MTGEPLRLVDAENVATEAEASAVIVVEAVWRGEEDVAAVTEAVDDADAESAPLGVTCAVELA